jgi:hypothetical protein
MIIGDFRIRNILKARRKNIRWIDEKPWGCEKRTHGRESVEMWIEGRKEQIRKKAANQVIRRLTRTTKNTPPCRRKASER